MILKKCLAIGGSENRMAEYDYLRVLAVFMVIITHAVQRDLSDGLVAGTWAQYIMTVLYVYCLACNLIYVMLSGALLLPYREEKLSYFYLKRFIKVVIPMFVYFLLYLCMKGELQGINLETADIVLKRFISGDTPECPHYWLIYTIISLYIVFPFLRYMFKSMPYRMLTSLVIVIIVFMSLNLYLPFIYTTSYVGTFMAGWIGVAVWGYWIGRTETRRYDGILMATGAAAFIVMAILVWFREDYLYLCCNCSPIMLLVASGLCAVVFRMPDKILKPNYLLSLLSKYSYSIILLHWGVLHGITRKYFHIYTVNYFYIGGIIVSSVCTVAISLIAAIVIDNIIVIVPQTMAKIVIRLCRKGSVAWKARSK